MGTSAPVELVASTVMSSGPTTRTSVTVTLNAAVVAWLARSAATQETLVTPIGNSACEVGRHSTGTGPSSTSVAWTLKLTAAPWALVASANRLGSAPNTGLCVSAV